MASKPKGPDPLQFKALLAQLGPTDSPASYLARTLGLEGICKLFGSLDDSEIEALIYDLDFWARREQVPPEVFSLCFILAGRAFGKSWAGARWVIEKAKSAKTIGALIGPTSADVRDTMIRGPSGILALSPPWFMPKYEPSKRRLTWPNGVYAICYSADKPDRLRGPNVGWAWGDEPASWKADMAALDQLPLILRIGTKANPPQLLLTGTPRPLKKLADLLYSDAEHTTLKPGVTLRTGSSLNNAANLAPDFVRNMRALSHTRWGQQEILGQLLLDNPGALFSRANWIRVEADAYAYSRTLDRVIVSVDPSQTSETGSDETGIIVAGVRTIDGLKHISVLADCSIRGSPREWATAAINAYVSYGASTIVSEVNVGGELVGMTINTVASEMGIPVNLATVRAMNAKASRAEPVSALAESGRIELIGHFPKLERQLHSFTGMNGRSKDDRADALVWAVHELAFTDTFIALY